MFHKNWLKISLTAAVLLCCQSMSTAQTLPGSYTTSWLGNSFPGTPTDGDWSNPEHVQDDIQAMYVASNGTVYTDSIWDEGGSEAGIYQSAANTGNCGDLHSWGRFGGQAVASDGNYVYVAMGVNGQSATGGTNSNGNPEYPPNNTTVWYGVRRYTLAGASAPFSAGYGDDADMLVVTTNGTDTGGNNVITGLTCSGGLLYVSDVADGCVKSYQTSSLSQTPYGTLTGHAGIAGLSADGYGNVWGLQYTGSAYTSFGSSIDSVGYTGGTGCQLICLYTIGGHVGGSGVISFASGDHPVAVAYNAYSGLFMVADQGSDQNIKCYNPTSFSGSPTTVASTIGATGGIYSGTLGQNGTLRFNMPSGVGADSSGNIYVSQDGSCQLGGTVLESYTPSGSRNWALYGLQWLDNADIDPSSQTDVYTNRGHFTMNWNSTTPGSEWTYAGYTIDPFAYPEDPRLHLGPMTNTQNSPMMRRIDGSLFMFVTDQYANTLGVYRFNSTSEGQIAIPSGLFAQQPDVTEQAITPDRTGWPENQPSAGEWIWRDSNGNGTIDSGEYNQPSTFDPWEEDWGWYVDSSGDVWEAGQTGVRHYKCQGLDSYGNPIYNYTNMTTTALPSVFTEVDRIEYFPSTDTMYLSGYTSSYPNSSNDWGVIGKVIYRYDNWSTSPTVHSGYPIVLNFSDSSSPQIWPASMDVNGQYLFVTYAAQNWIYVYNIATGAESGMITPGSDVGGDSSVDAGTSRCLGYTDIRMGIRGFERANGEYDIFNEDDWLGKVMMYRWDAGPSAPTGLTATPGNSQVSLSWTGSSGATSYDIFRGTSAGGESTTPIATGVTTTSYTDTGVSNGVTYFYEVEAVDVAGTSAYSNEVSATPSYPNLLTDPGFELNPINANGWADSYWSGTPTFTWSSSVHHGGSYSAEISGSGIDAAYFTGYSPYIAVSPSTPYKFSAWVDTSSLTGTGVFVVLSLFTSTGTWIENLQTSSLTGTNGWTQLSSTVTLPSNATQADFYLYCDGSGTAYFDDVSLTKE